MPNRLLKRLRRFHGDRKAIAAVEFALVFPLMMLMYFGSAETTIAVTAGHKLGDVALEMGLLLSAEVSKNLQDSDFDAIFQAATPMMFPFNIAGGKLSITLTSVTFVPIAQGSTTYNAMVDWSVTTGTKANLRPCSTALTLTGDTVGPSPTTLHGSLVQGGSLLIVDLVYNYPTPFNINFKTPLGQYHSPPLIVMKRINTEAPRNFPQLAYAGGTTYTENICPLNTP